LKQTPIPVSQYSFNSQYLKLAMKNSSVDMAAKTAKEFDPISEDTG
jgi:hypothetical protein